SCPMIATSLKPLVAEMELAEKLPNESRFTIAFGVLALVGATVQFRPSVPLPITGEPLTVKSESGAVRPTLVRVPAPGNVWPAANVICPLLPNLNPVSVGEFDPVPKSRFRVPLGALVLFPVGSDCH